MNKEKKLTVNDPCPCGSGKTLKKCCYNKYISMFNCYQNFEELKKSISELLQHTEYVKQKLLTDQERIRDISFKLVNNNELKDLYFSYEDIIKVINKLGMPPLEILKDINGINYVREGLKIIFKNKIKRKNFILNMLKLIPNMLVEKRYEEAWLILLTVDMFEKSELLGEMILPITFGLFVKGLEDHIYNNETNKLIDLLQKFNITSIEDIPDPGTKEFNLLVDKVKQEPNFLTNFNDLMNLENIKNLTDEQLNKLLIDSINTVEYEDFKELYFSSEELQPYIKIIKDYLEQFEITENKIKNPIFQIELRKKIVLVARQIIKDLITITKKDEIIKTLEKIKKKIQKEDSEDVTFSEYSRYNKKRILIIESALIGIKGEPPNNMFLLNLALASLKREFSILYG